MRFSREGGQVLEVLGRFHGITLVEGLTGIGNAQRRTKPEYHAARLLCQQIGVGTGRAIELIRGDVEAVNHAGVELPECQRGAHRDAASDF
ncbi:MAG TPA: hypothetical protein VFO16_20700 [Pseudonocardiaceae bacterium]|nr:hypothetical protein [Pseudonocardiaceae bacterium]